MIEVTLMSSLNSNPLNLLPKEAYINIPVINNQILNDREKAIVYAHLYGLVGDWFITGVANDGKTAYGYKDIRVEAEWELDEWFTNQKGWGEIPIANLQELVNKKLIQEKDIRFLISRDLDWITQPFLEIQAFESTLKYPGTHNRNR